MLAQYRKTIILSAAGILAAGLVYIFSELFLILAISLLIALVLDPIVNIFEKQRMTRTTAVFIVLTGLSLLIYTGLTLLVPALVQQSGALMTTLKGISVETELSRLENTIHQLFPFLERDFIANRLQTIISDTIENIFNQFAGIVTNVFSVLAVLVILPFTTFFFLKDKDQIIKNILDILPNKYFEMSFYISRKVSYQLSRYVRGWLLDALFVGFACGLGFYLLGINNYVTLGIIAGLGHLVPYFGPIIGGVPALIISLLQFGDLSHAPQILLVLAIIYVVDNGFVQPYVFSKSVNMHPVAIITLIVAGGLSGGIFGMLLAVPAATVIRTFMVEIYNGFKNYRITRVNYEV
ncbi:MAG: hypothetical protein FMNOHCHN_00873 [Ignavibacteriaceae bacterium]|nr:hypothetical protein [Ignavibacteriaceae bacterium]MCK6613468.1 AI-2E family transporter [Ignavibacteriaceae bacterium]